MKVIGLDGKQYTMRLKNGKTRNASKLHKAAREIIKKVFRRYNFYQEVTLKGTKTHRNSTLSADFLIPGPRVIIEVHGRQHYEQCWFHKNEREFVQGQLRDETKKEWAELNGFVLIELPYNEVDNWEGILRSWQ
jgi:very-short-patch-repair endonuclease